MPASDLIELLEADHRRVTRLLAGGTLGRELVGELESHLVAEAQVLYPALRKHLPHAGAAVDELVETDHRLEEVLTDLDHEHMEPELVAVVRELFASHVRDQEAVFAELRPAAGPEELDRLADVLGQVVMEAPTHPHPHLPREGPFERVADSLASTVDHLRDALRREGHRD
jgi:hypothetical protein